MCRIKPFTRKIKLKNDAGRIIEISLINYLFIYIKNCTLGRGLHLDSLRLSHTLLGKFLDAIKKLELMIEIR